MGTKASLRSSTPRRWALAVHRAATGLEYRRGSVNVSILVYTMAASAACACQLHFPGILLPEGSLPGALADSSSG